MRNWGQHYYRTLIGLLTGIALSVLAGCNGSTGIVPGSGIELDVPSDTASDTDTTPSGTGDSTSGGTQADTASGTGSNDVLGSEPIPFCIQTAQPSDTLHRAMFDALNAYRTQAGLPTLIYSRRLEIAADAHCQDLWNRRFFDHINPDGRNPGQRAVLVGFCHEYVGENIAAGQSSVQTVMTAWRNSPAHNENMLEPQYRYVGMGVSTDENGRIYWAQEFAFHVPETDAN